MSRTKKGKPSPGKEYWGRRPLGFGAGGRPENKKKEKRIGIKKERAILKRELKKQVKDE